MLPHMLMLWLVLRLEHQPAGLVNLRRQGPATQHQYEYDEPIADVPLEERNNAAFTLFSLTIADL